MFKKISAVILTVMCLFSLIPMSVAAADSGNSPYGPGYGTILTIGSIEQDGIYSNGKEPIRWMILEKRGNKALIVSKKILEFLPYNNTCQNVTWETCSLRKWLNNDFYNTAFSDREKKAIQATTVQAEDSPWFEVRGGRNTTDKVFLLSSDEAYNYYVTDAERIAEMTQYVYDQMSDGNEYCYWWWVRTPGETGSKAVCINPDGSYNVNGDNVDFDTGVRPAMWVDLTKLS